MNPDTAWCSHRGRCVRSRRRVALHNHTARPAARRWNPGLRHRVLTRRRPLVPAHGRSPVLHRLFRTGKRRAHGADSYGRAEGWSDGLSTSDRARYVPGLGLRLSFRRSARQGCRRISRRLLTKGHSEGPDLIHCRIRPYLNQGGAAAGRRQGPGPGRQHRSRCGPGQPRRRESPALRAGLCSTRDLCLLWQKPRPGGGRGFCHLTH